jgi:enoyl-CoA hydratase/carnithine racemase
MFELRVEGSIASIVLNRGGRRNAITIEAWKTLERLVHSVNDSPAVAIVLRSDEPGSFCAGADLDELWSLSRNVNLRKRFRCAVAKAMERVRTVNKPTIALVNGGCFGLGVSLSTACDIRIATPNASFAITPAQFGISYPQGDLARLTELVGRGQGARLIFGCERIDAEEAHRIGLVEMLDRDGHTAEAFLQGIVANAPTSLRALKAGLLNRFGHEQNFDACFGTSDFIERFGRARRGAASSSTATA